MFEGKASAAVTPEGDVKIPSAFVGEMRRKYGETPDLFTFGAQFLYVCGKDQAEKLVRRIDAQLLRACEDGARQVTAYLKRSAALLMPSKLSADGKIRISSAAADMLGVARGGKLMLLGMGEYMELWNPKVFEKRIRHLEKNIRSWDCAELSVLELPICMQEESCSLLKDGGPDPRACGPCQFMRFP